MQSHLYYSNNNLFTSYQVNKLITVITIYECLCAYVCVCGGGRKINWTELQTSLILTGEGVNLNLDIGGQGAQDRFVFCFVFFFACHELMTLWSRNCSQALCCSMIFFFFLTCLIDYFFWCWRIWWWRKLRKFRRRINKSFEVPWTKGTDNQYLVKHFAKRSWQHTIWHWWSLRLCGYRQQQH